jgi:hypothetical protein
MSRPRVPIIMPLALWSCSGVFLLAWLGLGAATTTTAPAVPIDLSTPKAAAKTLFRGISAGDREAVRAVFFAADPAQEKLATATVDLIVNGKRLGDAARERFGAAGDPIGRGMLDPQDLERLDAAQIKETPGGDSATMEVPGQSRPMSFRKQDGKWRLVVTDFGGASPDNITKQTSLVRMMANAMDESARDVAAGKYQTPEAAIAAIQKRLHEVMLNFNRPATTRATATTQP